MKNSQKGFANIVLIMVIIGIVAVGGYFVFVKKSEPIAQQPTLTPTQTTTPTKTVTPTPPITSNGHILAFEQAVNKSDFNNASKYFADKVYVLLEGSSCCGDIPVSQAKMYLENETKGLVFTFNPNDAVVKEYMTSMASDYPNRRLIKDSPKLYFDELSIGVESDVSQPNKASIGYKVSNDKITVLFINKGRDRSTPKMLTPSITSLRPTSGRYGTSVTITGTGFTSTGNKIKFGDLNTENSPDYNLVSTNGTTLTFTVPKYPYVSCPTGGPCTMFSGSGRTGTFDVSVININGTSNSISFTTLPPEFLEP